MSYSTPNIYLTFQGVSFSTGKSRSFNAMVGSQPPTITGGYANYNSIARPLQRSLTIFTGYDPVQMVVNIRMLKTNPPGKVASGGGGVSTVSNPRLSSGANLSPPAQVGSVGNLGGWLTDDTAGDSLEIDIDALEWMAGSNFAAGPSPVVYIWSYGSGGGLTDLIPPQYASIKGIPWIITSLQWGQAYRNESGFRIWQEAAITLEGYLNINKAPNAVTTAPGGYFVSQKNYDTVMSIVASAKVNSPITDRNTLSAQIKINSKNNPCANNRNIKLRGYGLRQLIPHGTKVWIPGHTIS